MDVSGPWGDRDVSDLLASPGVFRAKPHHDSWRMRGNGPDEASLRFHAFALGRVAADEAELLKIAADPGHGRQGIGSASQPSRRRRNRGARCDPSLKWRRQTKPPAAST